MLLFLKEKYLISSWFYDKIMSNIFFVLGVPSVKNFMNAMYALNMILQSFWCLLFPAGVGALLAYLLSAKAGVGNWIYIVLILVGFGIGLISMIRFLISALAGLERLEEEQKRKK